MQRNVLIAGFGTAAPARVEPTVVVERLYEDTFVVLATPTTAVPAPTTTAAGTQTRTYTSSGGSFTLQWTSRSMSVVSTAPAPGYTARVEGGGRELEIRFASPDRDVEIAVTLVSGTPRVIGL